MREVAIVGVGQTQVREHWDMSVRDLAVAAGRGAMADAGIDHVDAIYVGNMLSGALDKQEQIGALITDWVGTTRGVESFKIEAACGSGAAAFRMALMAVASGEMDSAIAVGVEKMTDALPKETTSGLATAADADWEVIHGLSFVAINALVMQRYMYEHGWDHADFAPFSINAHANAVHNPNARLQFNISTEDYQSAAMISAPINLLDASPIGDGAAAALLVPVDHFPFDVGKLAIRVTGSGSATSSIAVHDRRDPLWLRAAELSAIQAYRQSGLGPAKIDFFELHDAFSIMTALSLEACGFAERGQGVRLAQEGAIEPTGSIPIATMGGLKARGHPVGATGLYQLVEATLQLRGQAGEAQIDGARTAMTQNIGGSGATVVTHILHKP